MSTEKNMPKTDGGNAPPLASEKKAQTSRKRRRKLVKKSSDGKSVLNESTSAPLPGDTVSQEKNIPKADEGNGNALPVASEKKAQKSKKRRRKVVKKFPNEKSVLDESTSPVLTTIKKTPESLRPKKKNMKKSSNQYNKLGESSSTLIPSKMKTLTSPNSKGETVKKSSNKKPMPSNSKEIQDSQNPVKKPNKKSKPVNNQNRKPEVAKKGSHSGKEKEVESSSKNHSININMKNIGGFIFMCNAKTKPDCYKYRVMGIQAHKKDLVMGIKPGMKLFLYDIGVKLLYGIYKATSGGGMRLEPAAFAGEFPLQVRFEVQKDCRPLSESVFKKAIKENYNERTQKFKSELTFDQVKKLTNLFKPAPILHSTPQSVVHEPKPTVASSPLLLTEQDYRIYGLRGDRHKNLTPVGHPAYDPYRPGLEREGARMDTIFIEPKPTVASSPLLLTEQDYRSYGLRGDRHKNLAPVAPPAYDPFRPGLEREGARTDTVFISRPEQETVQLVKPTLTSPPVLLTEEEYRSYGLRGDRPPPVYDPYKLDQERDRARPDTVYLNRPYEQATVQLVKPTLTSPPVLLTEEEYRSYGLRGDRPPPVYDPYKLDQERGVDRPDTVYLNRPSEQESTQSLQLLNPTMTSPPTEQGYRSYALRAPPASDPYKTDQERQYSRAPADALYLSEKDYRTYGLKSRQDDSTSFTSNIDSTNHNPAVGFHQSVPYNPYDQDSDLVERYLPHHVAPPSSSYRFDPETILSERVYPGYVSNEPSNYNPNVGQRVDETGYKSAPVSSRYAFAGPSVIHR